MFSEPSGVLNELISSLLQLIAFALLPGLVYLIWYRSLYPFTKFLGHYSAPKKAVLLALATSLIFLAPPIVLVLNSSSFLEVLADPETMAGRFAQEGLSFSIVISILLTSLIKTWLSEELLFRGFIAKRLISGLGFRWGNAMQSLIFGGLHILIFALNPNNIYFISFMFVFSTLGGWFSAYLNERLADGSILPGWIMHGTANLVSYSVIGLFLL